MERGVSAVGQAAPGAVARRQEVEAKQQRIRSLLASLKLDAILITRRDNFAWVTGGGDNHVRLSTDEGAASLLIEPDRWTLIATNIETPRISREEIEGIAPAAMDVEPAPWHLGVEGAVERLLRGRRVGSDTGMAGTPNVHSALEGLRFPLMEQECERMRAIGVQAREALEGVFLRELAPGMTEFQVAGRVARALWDRGLEPTVLLVAADERIRQYRHPVPTNRVVDRCVMGVVCARRGGLIVALTRLAYMGRLPGDLRARHEAVCHVDAAFIDATRPQAKVAAILDAGQQAYRRHGYPDEWRLHHQGGAIAYAEREYLATPQSVQVVETPGAFAWNPSITGTKSEDTILVGARRAATDEAEVLTRCGPEWPTVSVPVSTGTLERPAILELARTRTAG